MSPPASVQKSQRRRFVRAINALLLVLLPLSYWFYGPLPTSGGGSPDGFLTTRLKAHSYATIPLQDEIGFTRLTPPNLNGWHHLFAEPVQTPDAYRAARHVRPTPQRNTIVLQPIGPLDAKRMRLLHDLSDFCAAYFQIPVRIAPPLSLDINHVRRESRALNSAAVSGTKQYNASEFIGLLSTQIPGDAMLYLGVTMADLYAENLNYVFGQGSETLHTGIYSLCRYYPEFWNETPRPGDDELALRRSCQVLAHETGHMLSLPHCVFYKCVMNGSNGLDDSDDAPLDFCPLCHRKILWNLGCDGTKRYTDLLAFYQKHGLDKEAKWTAIRLKNWQALSQ